jgi:hypothetical protein
MPGPEQFMKILVLICMAIASLASLAAFRFNFSEPLKTLSKVWLCMFLLEIIGHLYDDDADNTWLYNVFNPFFYFFLINIYRVINTNEGIKNGIRIFNFLFIIFVLLNSIFYQGIFEGKFQTYTLIIGGGFLIFTASAYFIKLILSEEKESFSSDPFFWMSLGFIIYFGGTVPFLGMHNYLLNNFYEFHHFYFVYIYYGLSIFLNLTISIAFLCKTPYLKLS